MKGWRALFYKEILRFWKVSFQTIAAPVLSAVLYLLIFGHVLEDRVQVYGQLKYTSFLLPGLIMMSLLQNAFANSSSSMVQSKIMGNLVFILLSPLGQLVQCLCLVRHGQRTGGGLGRVARDVVFCPSELCVSTLDLGVCASWSGHVGNAWIDRRTLGREV